MDSNSGLCNVRMWKLFMEIFDMDDDYLMEEVLALDYYDQPHVERIVNNYMLNGGITPEERQRLIGFYILVWDDGELED